MKTRCPRCVIVVVLYMLTAYSTLALADPLPRLETRGTRIVEAESGKVLELRGVNLGNWLLIEPGVFPDNPSRIRDGWTLKQIFVERFGKAQAERLMELSYDLSSPTPTSTASRRSASTSCASASTMKSSKPSRACCGSSGTGTSTARSTPANRAACTS